MAFTNTKESGLESLIVKWLVEQNGYEEGTNADYNKEYAVDETRLFRFLQDTQPKEMDKLGVFTSDTKKRQFLNRLSGEIAKRGIIDVLRNGVKVYPADLIMFYLTPTENNEQARIMYEKNIFSVTRQLRYSQDAGKLALDVCLFINGLPVITMELKNQLTKQNTENAVRQYKEDRDFHDLLFSFKRCMVHFAVDDATIQFCTKLAGKDSWFLPFNKGYNDGAGNPPNPDGLMTDYLWKDILTKRKLSRIIENYAQVVEEVDEDTKKKSVKQIWPRYHQLDCVEKLLADVQENGVGKRYLIQHSAGSGKSNSIAWLAHQLIGLEKDGHPMIDSVLVVTDRRILDKQIRNTIKQFMQVKNTVVWAEHSGDLRKAIQDGKRIIISTIEKFPYIISEIGQEHKNNKFAIIIDEAHSGQSGRNSANMNLALSGLATDDEADNEDKINAMMEGRKLVSSASYFAFTATPKNKTEEMFGIAYEEDGEIKHRPFHVYTMKQAIQEGFILDVLRNYTTIDSWYKIMKTVEDDPMFDKKRAQKKLRAFVEAIAIKLEDADAEIAPVPAGKVGHIVEPEMDLLSKIIMDFNDMFGNINWNDTDNVQRQILAIPEMVSRDKKYQNAMKNSDEQEARTESERALQQVIFSIMADNMELFKQFQDNPSFKKWLSDLVFNLTYNPEGKEYVMPESGGKADDYDFSTQESLLTAEDSASYGNKKDGK